MDKITSKFGVVSLDAPDARLPIHTNKSGPDAVWDMIVDNAKYKGYTINRADYEVSGPYTPEGATSNRVTRVDITNKSDPLFKIDSETYIDYVRHDMSVADSLTLPYSHTTLEALIGRLNSTSGVSLSIDDFDIDYSHRDDGIWNLKSSDVSYFFTPGTYATLYDRGGWTKIANWFATDTIPDLRGLILNLEQPTWDVRRDAVKYIQSNRAFDIPWDDLIEHPLDKNADGSYRYFLDRKPLMEYIEPQWIQYRKLTLSEYMQHPGAATTGVIPFDRQGRVNFSTKDLFNQAASGTGSGGYVAATDTFFIDTTNKSYNRINIPTDFVGVDWKFLHDSIAKIEFTSTYRKGRYWFKLGGEQPDIGSFVDNPIPELDRKNILGISEEASDIPLRFEYFLDFSDVNVPLSTLFINGEFVWEGPITRKFSDNPGSSTGEFIFLAGTSNYSGTHSRLEITDFNLHVLPLGSPKESSYVQVNASVTELSDGTIYENLPRLNEFYKVHLTEENVEDGPLSTTEPTTLVARDGDVIIEAESEFIVDTAPNLASVFLNTDLDGFDGWDRLGPGQQVSYIGYEYPDGRHTRYMGRVQDTELFIPQEIVDQLPFTPEMDPKIAYPSTLWFKYELDGEIIYIPQKPIFGNITYNQLKGLDMVARGGDHLARRGPGMTGNYKSEIEADYRNQTVFKDGRHYSVRLIKTLLGDGPAPFTTAADDDSVTHDSEWNRLMYNLTAKSVSNSTTDNHSSQRGPKWEYLTSPEMTTDNNGASFRYSYMAEQVIESGIPKAIYRGCYGVSRRGRGSGGLDNSEYPAMGVRPMLKLIQPPNREYLLDAYRYGGNIGLDFSRDSDFDVCRDPELFRRRVGEDTFTKVEVYTNEDFLYEIDKVLDLDAEFYATHSDLSDRYTTKTLVLTEDILSAGPLTVLGAEGKSSGIYDVVDDLGNTFPAYVDMETAGGGWILAARWTGRFTRNVFSSDIHWEGHEVKGYTEDPVNYPVIPEGHILENHAAQYMVKSSNPSWKEYFGDWSIAELNIGDGVTTAGFPVRTSIGDKTMYLQRNGWSETHPKNHYMGFWTHGNNSGPCGGNNRVGPNKCCPMASTSDSNHGDFTSHVKEVYLKASTITPPKGVDPIEGELIRYHQDFTGALPDVSYASLAGRTAAGKYPTTDVDWNTFTLGYWNLNMQPYSSGWGTARNTTRYISQMSSEIRDGNYRALIRARYRLGNGNRATTNRWDMGITFTTDNSFDLNVRDLRIVVDFKNIGAQTNIGIYDHASQFVTIPYSNRFRRLELILRGTRLKVMLDGIILREANCVYVGTSHTYSIGLGVRYAAVNNTNINEPLWGMEISNMFISTIPKE